MDAAPSSSLNPYSRKADACASSVAAPAAPPPPSKRPKKTYYCQICDQEMPDFNERCHSCKRHGCTECITFPGPTHVKPSCVLCDIDDGASQVSAWRELLLARTCRRMYHARISQRLLFLAELQQDMGFPPAPTHHILSATESYASTETRGSHSPCSSCFTPPNAFYTFPQTWCTEEDLPTPSSTLPSPPRHASCRHIQNEERMLFNQWWTQTSDATFLQRVQAKRTRDFPQDFVDPATPPEPSPKTPRSQELPLQGSSSQATTRAAEAAEKRRQDAWKRGGIADPEALRQRQHDLEQEVKRQKKDNTGGEFGATRAVALREQLRRSRTSSSLQSSEQTH